MASVAVLVVSSNQSIGDLKAKLASTDTTNKQAMVALLMNYLSQVESGSKEPCQLTIRDTDPGVTTSGTGSAQYSF